jgi:hypothetical protein
MGQRACSMHAAGSTQPCFGMPPAAATQLHSLSPTRSLSLTIATQLHSLSHTLSVTHHPAVLRVPPAAATQLHSLSPTRSVSLTVATHAAGGGQGELAHRSGVRHGGRRTGLRVAVGRASVPPVGGALQKAVRRAVPHRRAAPRRLPQGALSTPKPKGPTPVPDPSSLQSSPRGPTASGEGPARPIL